MGTSLKSDWPQDWMNTRKNVLLRNRITNFDNIQSSTHTKLLYQNHTEGLQKHLDLSVPYRCYFCWNSWSIIAELAKSLFLIHSKENLKCQTFHKYKIHRHFKWRHWNPIRSQKERWQIPVQNVLLLPVILSQCPATSSDPITVSCYFQWSYHSVLLFPVILSHCPATASDPITLSCYFQWSYHTAMLLPVILSHCSATSSDPISVLLLPVILSQCPEGLPRQ